MALTMKHIQSALDHLGQLRPARLNLSAKRDFSLRETVLFMAPKLTEMKELGFTSRELTAALADQGIVLKAPTMNRYLSEYQAGRGKKVTTETAAPVPPELKTEPLAETESAKATPTDVSESSQADPPEPSVVEPEEYDEDYDTEIEEDSEVVAIHSVPRI